MFGLFKKKQPPIKTMIGKIHAFYKFTSIPPDRGEFIYNLFITSDGRRSYEIEVVANHQMLYKYYTMERSNQGCSYHDMLATHHKFWLQIVAPWLNGADLHPKYHISACKHPRYISKGLKHEVIDIMNEILFDGQNVHAKLSAVKDLLVDAIDA